MSDKRKQFALTTFDNPFDPFDNFSDWNDFDKEKGYNSCEYLARQTVISSEFSQKEEQEATERAIDKIIANDPFGIYMKIRENPSDD